MSEHDVLLDFEGAGVVGGDELDLENVSLLVFAGELSGQPNPGAALPGAGNGVTELVYAFKAGNTWLLADENDNGALDQSDFAL